MQRTEVLDDSISVGLPTFPPEEEKSRKMASLSILGWGNDERRLEVI
jgi:hypothetical protein